MGAPAGSLRKPDLALGVAAFSAPEDWSCGRARDVLCAACGDGIRRFDTSALYGGGVSEEGLGRFLHASDDPGIRVTTKCGRYRRYGAPAPNKSGAPDWYDYSREATLASVERSVSRLGDGRIDIVFIHDPDNHMAEALGGAYSALRELKDQGVIGGVGIATNFAATARAMLEQVSFDALMLANSYSILDPWTAAKALELARKSGARTCIAGAYLSGILATGLSGSRSYRYALAPSDVQAAVGELEVACRGHAISLKQLTLACLMRNRLVDCVTLGASSAEQIRESIGYAGKPISDDVWSDIRKAQAVNKRSLAKSGFLK